MNAAKVTLTLRAACVLGLAALALMVWSLFDPRPIPVVVAMSVGQLLGTLSLGAFLFVVFLDLRRANAKKGDQVVEPTAVVDQKADIKKA
jgi:hypothetical protein